MMTAFVYFILYIKFTLFMDVLVISNLFVFAVSVQSKVTEKAIKNVSKKILINPKSLNLC